MAARARRILCPVDFSECSRNALVHALGLARCYGSTVTALHVASPATLVAGVPGPADVVPMPNEPADLDAVNVLLRQMVEAEQVPGVSVDVLVSQSSDIDGEILAQAEHVDADLIVIGTHGRGKVGRLLLGSVAERVLRQSVCPVVTVPINAPEAMPRGPAPFARIVCGIDFSPSSECALETAVALAQESRGTLVLVHAIEVLPLYYDFAPPAVIDLDAWRKDAAERLHGLVPGDARTTCDVREIVIRGKAYQGILELAESIKADLIVLGTQGRGAIDRFFFGATANHVVRQAQCAVMTLRSQPFARPQTWQGESGQRRHEPAAVRRSSQS